MESSEDYISTKSGEESDLSVEPVFPVRPKSSKMGKPISLRVNYFELDVKLGSKNALFEYKISTIPKLTCHSNKEKMTLKNIVKKMSGKLEVLFKTKSTGSKASSKTQNANAYIYRDGFLYSLVKVSESEMLSGEEVEIDGETYLVNVSLFKEMSFEDSWASRFFRTFLNQIYRKLGFISLFNGKHLDPNSWYPLDGVNVYYAYYNTTKWIDGKIYLNLNPWIKFFQQETVLDRIYRNYDKKLINFELKGKSFMTIYNSKIYSIDEIIFAKNAGSKFYWSRQRKEISYAEYLKINYNWIVTENDQPLIKFFDRKMKKDIYFVPEFCVLTGITEYQKSKNFIKFKDDLYAKAEIKMKQINDFFEKIKGDSKEYSKASKQWNIDIVETPIKVDAYKWTPGSIYWNKNQKLELSKYSKDFSTQLNAPLKGSSITSWAILYGSSSIEAYESFSEYLEYALQEDYKYNYWNPIIEEISNELNPKSWINSIKKLSKHNKLQFIICIAPGEKKNSPIYCDLKYFLQTEVEIPSQVVLSSTIYKNYKCLRNIAKNIMIQISAKIGDTPWGFKNLPLMDKPTMVVGIDVCHRIGKNNKSVLAFVALLDEKLWRYYSTYVAQEERQEIGDSIEKAFKEAITEFKKLRGVEPEQIFIFRDAVSEGQSQAIIEKELPQLKLAILNLKSQGFLEETPKVLTILANKRIEQRFFSESKGKYINPEKGLVIYDGITRPSRFEYYMISQAGPTGLQCPVRYEVIYNTFDLFDPKDLYDLTNTLCYGYYNLQSSIKVPAPVMYAHMMCDQISRICYAKSEVVQPSDNLKLKLYYI